MHINVIPVHDSHTSEMLIFGLENNIRPERIIDDIDVIMPNENDIERLDPYDDLLAELDSLLDVELDNVFFEKNSATHRHKTLGDLVDELLDLFILDKGIDETSPSPNLVEYIHAGISFVTSGLNIARVRITCTFDVKFMQYVFWMLLYLLGCSWCKLFAILLLVHPKHFRKRVHTLYFPWKR